jgi:hypothetical protein
MYPSCAISNLLLKAQILFGQCYCSVKVKISKDLSFKLYSSWSTQLGSSWPGDNQ